MTFEEITKSIPNVATNYYAIQMAKNVLSDILNLDYINVYEVKYSEQKIISKEVLANDNNGYLFLTRTGLVIICLNKNTELPIVKYMYIREIKSMFIESKLFTSYMKIDTNDTNYTFKVSKKDLFNIESTINEIRQKL